MSIFHFQINWKHESLIVDVDVINNFSVQQGTFCSATWCESLNLGDVLYNMTALRVNARNIVPETFCLVVKQNATCSSIYSHLYTMNRVNHKHPGHLCSGLQARIH